MHCDSAFCQNLEGIVLWHTLLKFIFLRDYLTKFNGVFCKMQVISNSFIFSEVMLWFILYFESYWCGKSDCNFVWDIRYNHEYTVDYFDTTAWKQAQSLQKHANIMPILGCVHAYFAKAESTFWNADSKRRSKTPLIQAIVRAQVNRKGVYMTSFKRGYNVILRSCFHQNQRFALTTIVNAHFWAAFMLILRRRFETLIQNADPKRRSRKYCSCFPREEDDTFTEEGMSRNSRNVYFRLLFELKWTGKAFIWRHLNVVIMWFCVHASTRISVLL